MNHQADTPHSLRFSQNRHCCSLTQGWPAGRICQARSREMVEWLTLQLRPISVRDSPASRRAIASRI